MGTASDWISAAFWGVVLWGGWMLFWEAHSRRERNIKPLLSIMDVLGWTLAGLGFGIVTVFHWKAFHWPLILFLVATEAGAGIALRLARRKLRSDALPPLWPANSR
jgi:hypothetical protein